TIKQLLSHLESLCLSMTVSVDSKTVPAFNCGVLGGLYTRLAAFARAQNPAKANICERLSQLFSVAHANRLCLGPQMLFLALPPLDAASLVLQTDSKALEAHASLSSHHPVLLDMMQPLQTVPGDILVPVPLETIAGPKYKGIYIPYYLPKTTQGNSPDKSIMLSFKAPPPMQIQIAGPAPDTLSGTMDHVL
ncbi:hypothetical protein KIPB_010427, partial [Kipferlia bialata]